jgi:hypothetical protein
MKQLSDKKSANIYTNALEYASKWVVIKWIGIFG